MVNLDRKVFGDITLKEVIGANPPLETFQESLENQFQLLKQNLDSKNKEQLQSLMVYQIEAEKEANNRPGSMALAQDKIQVLVNYNQKYLDEIKKKL